MTIVKKNLAFESQWVKWKQNWNFRSVSKLAKSRLCSTYARCQLCQQRLRTDGRLLDTLTEPGSLWSMSPLSSPCRMETVAWIFTMEISHTALWNAMLSIQLSNQQLFSTPFCPSKELQGMMSRCIFWHGQVLPVRSNSHAAGQHTHTPKSSQIHPNPVSISFPMTIVKNILPSNPNESNGSRIEISARSKFAKSSCCITYAGCQLSQQCAFTGCQTSWYLGGT